MSTKTPDPLSIELDQVDKKRNELEAKLPFYKRWNRRYLTGPAFASWQISSLFTWAKAIGLAKVLFGGKTLAAALATKYPVAYGFTVAAWEKICLITVASIAVGKEVV